MDTHKNVYLLQDYLMCYFLSCIFHMKIQGTVCSAATKRLRKFAICYRCDTFTYRQISCSFWLFAEFVLARDQHIFVDVLLQTFYRVDWQVELNSKHQVR